MLAAILSVLIVDGPQASTYFLPEVFSGYESKYISPPLNQDTPFMLQYEWKLNRDEAAVSAVPSNRETWTEFATVLQIKLPTRIEQEASDKLTRIMFSSLDRPSHNLWSMAMAHRYPISQSTIPVVRYQLTKKPTAIASQYEGVIHCVPAITARAKTIEALEAKLLEMYCDYITQMVEEDTLQAVNNAKACNPLERVPPGWWDIPAVQFGY
jgi:hypothetical protein